MIRLRNYTVWIARHRSAMLPPRIACRSTRPSSGRSEDLPDSHDANSYHGTRQSETEMAQENVPNARSSEEGRANKEVPPGGSSSVDCA